MTAYLTVDLGFGDSGKGSIVDFLVRQTDAHTVVRFNGGAQAGHRVVTPDGREHVFSQFGAGTLAGSRTFLSRFMFVEPLALLQEGEHLLALGVDDPFGMLTIDGRAPLTTPFQRGINRLKELAREDARHGSCGIGFGESVADFLNHGPDVVCAADLKDEHRLWQKVNFMRQINRAKLVEIVDRLPDSVRFSRRELWEDALALVQDRAWVEHTMEACLTLAEKVEIASPDYLNDLMSRPGHVVFEAAQGVLLDEWYGFHPHTTWSTTTLANADTLLAEAGYTEEVVRIGITRAYTTRHGAGPCVTEDAAMGAALPDRCNHFTPWQTGFRVGPLDLLLLRYAIEVVGRLDGLAVTCLDRLAEIDEIRLCQQYQVAGQSHSVERLPVKRVLEDLAVQADLTQFLTRCLPIYETVAQPDDLLLRLEERLGVPVCITSSGEACDDKRLTDLGEVLIAAGQPLHLVQ